MQETFVSVARAIGRFHHSHAGATFRGWLWTITRNKIRDRNRHFSRRGATYGIGGTAAQLQLDAIASPQTGELGEEPPSEIATDAAMIRRRMLELIRVDFEARTWTMFWETEIEGRSAADVAADLNVSKWAVYKARARVLNKLKTELVGIG